MREGHTGRRSGARRDGEGCGTMRKDDAMRPSPSAGQRVQRGSPVCSKAKSEGLRVQSQIRRSAGANAMCSPLGLLPCAPPRPGAAHWTQQGGERERKKIISRKEVDRGHRNTGVSGRPRGQSLRTPAAAGHSRSLIKSVSSSGNRADSNVRLGGGCV